MAAPTTRSRIIFLALSWVLLAIAVLALVFALNGDRTAFSATCVVILAYAAVLILYVRPRLGFNRRGDWPK